MSTQYIDFETTGDTGQNSSDSIQPVTDGEAATAAVFTRPSENLRVRTETLKSQVEQLKYLSDADRALLLTSSGDIAWAGLPTGTFTATSDVTLKPFLAPATSTPAKVTFTLEGSKTITFTSSTAGVTGRPRAYNGANELSVQFVGVDSATLASAIEGIPNNKFVVTYNSNAVTGTTSDDLQLFLSSGLPATQLAALKMVVTFSSTDTTVITPPSTEQRLSGAADAEKHVIAPSAFTAFFSSPTNVLTEGDVLCVWYDDLVLPSGGGRRQSIGEAPENIPPLDGSTVSSSSLFLLRLYPERLPGALPIATVQNGKLIFINNRAYGAGETGALVPGGATYQGSAPNAFADGATLPASTFEAALDSIVALLGTTSSPTGAEKIGIQAITGVGAAAGTFSTTAGGVKNAIGQVLAGANAHINLATAAHAGTAISTPAVVASPDSLATITVSGQLGELLARHNDHLNDTTAAHAATAISYTATTPVDITAGVITVASGLDQLDDKKAGLAIANVFTKNNTINNSVAGTAGLTITSAAGAGVGISATGGSTGGTGVVGIGGGSAGNGGYFETSLTASPGVAAVYGKAMSTNSSGVVGEGNGLGNGVYGNAYGTGAGVVGQIPGAAISSGLSAGVLGFGSATAPGVLGRGYGAGSAVKGDSATLGTGIGVEGLGGGSSAGVHGQGGATDGPGVWGVPGGNGPGLKATAGASGIGVEANGRIVSVTDPSADQDAATKAYVDAIVPQNNVINGDMTFWQRGTTALPLTITRQFLADRFYAFIASGSGANTTYNQLNFLGAGVYYAGISRAATLDTNLAKRSIVYEVDYDGDALGSTVKHLISSNLTKPLRIQFSHAIGTGLSGSLVFKLVSGTGGRYDTGYTSASVLYTSANLAGSPVGSLLVSIPPGTLPGTAKRLALVWEWTPTTNPAVTNENFNIRGVMLMVGSPSFVGVPNYAGRTLAGELLACQRFYEKSYDIDVNVQTSTSVGLELVPVSSVGALTSIRFQTPKRVTPVIAFWRSTGASAEWEHSGGTTGMGTISIGTRSFVPSKTDVPNAVPVNATVSGHWTADAEI